MGLTIMRQNMLIIIVVLLHMVCEGLSQGLCYEQRNCQGSTIQAGSQSARQCCVGTNNGMSYSVGGVCTVRQCVVHGFANAKYDVTEGDRLDTTFGLNVKGITSYNNLVLLGVITSERGTAQSSEFERLNIGVDGSSTDIQMFITNDLITLEYDDTVILRFTFTIDITQILTEYVRDTATVVIKDNDKLEISFEERRYSIREGETQCYSRINMHFRGTQSAFTITLRPISITMANTNYAVGDFVTTEGLNEATAGSDFTTTSHNIRIAATPNSPESIYEVVMTCSVINDAINEVEQSFILVAQLGDDVPNEFACFQRQRGDSECFGREGATEIRIMDNDPMIIGFSQRRRTVSEGDALYGTDSFTINMRVSSSRLSELSYSVPLRHLESSGNAVIEGFNEIWRSQLDAQFGSKSGQGDPLQYTIDLIAGSHSRTVPTSIINDFVPEENLKCYTIRIWIFDIYRYFTCNDDDANPTNYFCLHTICITDDDEPFVVAFVKTTYTVIESGGHVEVCVNLTHPQVDILDETLRVEVFNDENSVYIPTGATLATPDPPNFLGMYFMAPGTDYEEPIRGINRIRDTVINATRRIICYDQPIYNDLHLEASEYIGLTLAVRDSSIITEVKSLYDQAAIKIVDDDTAAGALVGLENTFELVSETAGVVQVCVVVHLPSVHCPIQFSFAVRVSTISQTAVSPNDFGSLSTILTFDACVTRRCVNVTIVDDELLESLESFSVTLQRASTLDSRITLAPTSGRIYIY